MRRLGIIATARFALAGALSVMVVPAAAEPIRLAVEIDARDVWRGIQHSHITLPVRPGVLTLAYPKWIPGEHRPNGPISQMINLRFLIGGKPLLWRRDPDNPFTFHLNIPQDARQLDVHFDYLSPARRFGGGFGKSPNVTPDLAFVLFNHLMLYPAAVRADDVRVVARLQVPEGWGIDGAVAPTRKNATTVVLPELPLAVLVDSPLLLGKRLNTVVLPDRRARLTIAADGAEPIDAGPEMIDALERLTNEMRVLAPDSSLSHDYVWLVAISDALSRDGLEHARSSDIRVAPGFFRNPRKKYQWSVLSHELFHAWNGKFRRPRGLATTDFMQPMSGELLWVYEGLTRYYGDVVLPARSGLASHAAVRDYLAFVGAQVERGRQGRTWRSIADTGVTAPIFADAPFDGTAARRGPDYYNETMLFWLEADMRIRRHSQGRRSLDDFCRLFLARGTGDPDVSRYDRADVIAALEVIAPLGWDAFFRARVDGIAPPKPLAGLAAAGWTLTWNDEPNPFLADVDVGSGIWNLSSSLGIHVTAEGVIRDIAPGSPADAASIAAGARILTIDGRPWTQAVAAERLRAAHAPLRLIVKQGQHERALDIDYSGGLQIPHLIRIPEADDTLSRILDPLAGKARS